MSKGGGLAARDIDGRDTEARHVLVREIRELRDRQGISQFKLAMRQGAGPEAQHNFEKSTNWNVNTVARVLRSLDAQFVMVPVGLPSDIEDDVMSIILKASQVYTAEDRDDLHISLTKNLLIRARIHMEVTTKEMAEIWDCTPTAISHWEEADRISMVFMMQRYTRCLPGCHLELTIDEKPEEIE